MPTVCQALREGSEQKRHSRCHGGEEGRWEVGQESKRLGSPGLGVLSTLMEHCVFYERSTSSDDRKRS